MKDKVLYIAEGEIEERFIKFLKQNNFIRAGRFKKFNLMQERLEDSCHILAKKVDKIYCVLDADIILPNTVSNLIFNLKKLRTVCKSENIICLIQQQNFEDELKFVLQCSDLGRFFGLPHSTVKDVKNFLAQKVDYAKHISKINLPRYCSRPFHLTNIRTNICSVAKCMIC